MNQRRCHSSIKALITSSIFLSLPCSTANSLARTKDRENTKVPSYASGACAQAWGMILNLRVPKVWKLFDLFKEWCQLRGWETSVHEDWVKRGDDEYHSFVWIRTVHSSTFEKICENHKFSIREGFSYQVVDVPFIAWIFLRSPPKNIIQRVKEKPECLKRTAIYDLSRAYTEERLCLKLNETESMVFKEFEKFLKEELRVKVKSMYEMPRARVPLLLHIPQIARARHLNRNFVTVFMSRKVCA